METGISIFTSASECLVNLCRYLPIIFSPRTLPAIKNNSEIVPAHQNVPWLECDDGSTCYSGVVQQRNKDEEKLGARSVAIR